MITPFIFGKVNLSLKNYFVTVFGEVQSLIVSLCLVDRKGFGRKNSLTIFFAASCIFHIANYFATGELLSSTCNATNFFMKLGFSLLYPYTSELYPTDFRTIGFGFCSGVGRLGAALIPYIMFPLIEADVKSPFIIFVVVAFVATVTSFTFPYDTRG
jgi:putative MFS transporter